MLIGKSWENIMPKTDFWGEEKYLLHIIPHVFL